MGLLTPKSRAVRNTIRDGMNNVTFIVMAARELTRAELLGLVHDFYAQPKIRRRKKPFRNATVRLTARDEPTNADTSADARVVFAPTVAGG